MEKWLIAIETNCSDPSREKEFNEWYNNTHLPDMLSMPGILRGTRYENPNAAEGQGKFLALYEVETEDVLQTMAALAENMTRWQEAGRVSELLRIHSGTFYRQIGTPLEKR